MKKNEDGSMIFENQEDLDATISDRLKRQEEKLTKDLEKKLEAKYQDQVSQSLKKIEELDKRLSSSPKPEEVEALTAEKNKYYEEMVGAKNMADKITQEKETELAELNKKLHAENERFRTEKAVNLLGAAYNGTTLDKKFQNWIIRDILNEINFAEDGEISIKSGEDQLKPDEFMKKYAEAHPEFCENGKPTPVPTSGDSKIQFDDPRKEQDRLMQEIRAEIQKSGIPKPKIYAGSEKE